MGNIASAIAVVWWWELRSRKMPLEIGSWKLPSSFSSNCSSSWTWVVALPLGSPWIFLSRSIICWEYIFDLDDDGDDCHWWCLCLAAAPAAAYTLPSNRPPPRPHRPDPYCQPPPPHHHHLDHHHLNHHHCHDNLFFFFNCYCYLYFQIFFVLVNRRLL